MIRIIIELPDDLSVLLDIEQRRCGVRADEIVAEALREYFARERERPAKELPFAKLGRTGFADTSVRIEEILAEEWGGAGRS